jgi:DNA-binding response OmpR family regulator
MDPILCYPDPVQPELIAALERTGYPWRGTNKLETAPASVPQGGYAGSIVSAASVGAAEAIDASRALRKAAGPALPLLILVKLEHIGRSELAEDVFNDVCILPCSPSELHLRLVRLFGPARRQQSSEVIAHDALALNTETYQASIAGRPLNLTYMEYELLKFLASRPGRVFTREVLLSSVWGYEYFGGARTVDVHIRRLRAKFGEEHAHLLQTVRSVGYRFGAPKWSS